MHSRRRPGRDPSEKTAPYRIYPAAPNYRGDEDQTLIRVSPVPLADEGTDAFESDLTLRHSSYGR